MRLPDIFRTSKEVKFPSLTEKQVRALHELVARGIRVNAFVHVSYGATSASFAGRITEVSVQYSTVTLDTGPILRSEVLTLKDICIYDKDVIQQAFKELDL